MRIAFLLLNQKDHVRRATAFLNNSPTHDYTFIVLAEEWEKRISHPFKLCHPIPAGANLVLGEANFDANLYDLVLPMADKVCDFLFDNVYPNLTNINNKRTLQRKIDEFGKFNSLKSSTNCFISEFFDDEDVIELLEQIALEVRGEVRYNYSGRGMFGKNCVGITCPDSIRCIEEAIKRGFSCACVDNMGMDAIVYWPHVASPGMEEKIK
jgi:hypothetical protein